MARYLPNPEPLGAAQYVLICMEPSLGRWANTAEHARSRVEAGFRNFLFSIEDFIFHFCVRRYLCRPEERYHVTELSKERCWSLVRDLQGSSDMTDGTRCWRKRSTSVPLPVLASLRLERSFRSIWRDGGSRRSFTRVIHYSGQAAPARTAGIVGREDAFQAFEDSVSIEDVVVTAEETLKAANVSSGMRDHTLSRLVRSQLTTSRKQLIFSYKIAFEAMRS